MKDGDHTTYPSESLPGPTAHQAAINFTPDDYQAESANVLGRHVASSGLLRAAMAAHAGQALWCWTTSQAEGDAFAKLVRASGLGITPGRIDPDKPEQLARLGTLNVAACNMDGFARWRLRFGPARWSLMGVTHTLSSQSAMDEICALHSSPVFAWDALVCTSHAALTAVRALLDAQNDYLKWRHGPGLGAPILPQLPVIPLGVHAQDFVLADGERAAARSRFGLKPDDVCVLFNGRLSFHAKAHPHPLYVALQQVAKATGRRIALMKCSWFAHPMIERAFKTGATRFAPDVTTLWPDGRNPKDRRAALAAADIFISLSDNIQETFGITPLEAMAASLPTVVSDWNGYKDTVTHGQTGFRIPTWMPPAPLGEPIALAHETRCLTYDRYIGAAALQTSVDMPALIAAVRALADSPDLRARMGAAGRAAVEQDFTWDIIYRQYQTLWGELAAIRAQAGAVPAPRCAPNHPDPFALFSHYPTALIGPGTHIAPGPNAAASLGVLRGHELYSWAAPGLPTDAVTGPILRVLAAGTITLAALAEATGIDQTALIQTVAWLAKTGHVALTAE